MTRSDLIRMLVLDEISDDYEEPQHIYAQLVTLCQQIGVAIEPRDVRRSLLDLVGLGFAKAYDLGKEPPQELAGSPPQERVGDYYYWITQQGREAQSAFDAWPFDDEGNIRYQ